MTNKFQTFQLGPSLDGNGSDAYQVFPMSDDGVLFVGQIRQIAYSDYPGWENDEGYFLAVTRSGVASVAGGYYTFDGPVSSLPSSDLTMTDGAVGVSRAVETFTSCINSSRSQVWFLDNPAWNVYSSGIDPNQPPGLVNNAYVRYLDLSSMTMTTVGPASTDGSVDGSITGLSGVLAVDDEETALFTADGINGFPEVGVVSVTIADPINSPTWTWAPPSTPGGQSLGILAGTSGGCYVTISRYLDYGVNQLQTSDLWFVDTSGAATQINTSTLYDGPTFYGGFQWAAFGGLWGSATVAAGAIYAVAAIATASDGSTGITTLVKIDLTTGEWAEVDPAWRSLSTNIGVAVTPDGAIWHVNNAYLSPYDDQAIRWGSTAAFTRQVPRDDNFGLGSPRQSVGAGPTSRQSSFRQGPANTYT